LKGKKVKKKELIQAKEIKKAYAKLKTTQSQLVESEKMASLGELTAGIAHEIQNPMNFINNFSELNKELLEEMKIEIEQGNLSELEPILEDVINNEQRINHHGKRADSIVKAMLQHGKQSSGRKESVDVNALVDKYFRMAYHGMLAKDKLFNVTMKSDYDSNLENIYMNPQDIGRVILNLINNAFYAVEVKKKKLSMEFESVVTVTTKSRNNKILISVRDNGDGIPKNIMNKIFQPFFTTKPTHLGTGLGLSQSYQIIKSTGGELKVKTIEGEGSEFIIVLVE